MTPEQVEPIVRFMRATWAHSMPAGANDTAEAYAVTLAASPYSAEDVTDAVRLMAADTADWPPVSAILDVAAEVRRARRWEADELERQKRKALPAPRNDNALAEYVRSMVNSGDRRKVGPYEAAMYRRIRDHGLPRTWDGAGLVIDPHERHESVTAFLAAMERQPEPDPEALAADFLAGRLTAEEIREYPDDRKSAVRDAVRRLREVAA